MPAPSKFNLDIATKIIHHARMGRYRVSAAALVGISDRTLKTWVQRGTRNKDEAEAGVADLDEFGRFVSELLAAEAEAKSACEGTIFKAALAGDVKAAHTWLKHRYPRDWGFQRAEALDDNGNDEHIGQTGSVTPDDTLAGLQAVARDPRVCMRDRVSAYKTILAWYSATKSRSDISPADGMGIEGALANALALQLGIPEEKDE